MIIEVSILSDSDLLTLLRRLRNPERDHLPFDILFLTIQYGIRKVFLRMEDSKITVRVKLQTGHIENLTPPGARAAPNLSFPTQKTEFFL